MQSQKLPSPPREKLESTITSRCAYPTSLDAQIPHKINPDLNPDPQAKSSNIPHTLTLVYHSQISYPVLHRLAL